MAELAERLSARFLELEFSESVPMCDYVSFKIGGPADAMAAPKNAVQLVEVYRWALSEGIPVMILGNGSNLLVSDKGVRGLVLRTCALSRVKVEDDGLTLSAQCGAKLSKAAMTACHAGLGGLAFAHGIPGTVGGAVYMNAGAYGGEMSGVVEATAYADAGGVLRELTGDGHRFGYRRSFFTERPECVILESRFKLTPCDKAEIKREMEDYAARRRDKQPLMQPSAGSVFKRPPGSYAGKLIEDSGLKGYSVGGAQVSEKHAGFIVNRGGATCRDVLVLIEIIQKTVHTRSGVMLEPEVRVVGEQ